MKVHFWFFFLLSHFCLQLRRQFATKSVPTEVGEASSSERGADTQLDKAQIQYALKTLHSQHEAYSPRAYENLNRMTLYREESAIESQVSATFECQPKSTALKMYCRRMTFHTQSASYLVERSAFVLSLKTHLDMTRDMFEAVDFS